MPKKMRDQANQTLAKDVEEVSHTVSKCDQTNTDLLSTCAHDSKSTKFTGFTTTMNSEELVYYRPHSPAGESGYNP